MVHCFFVATTQHYSGRFPPCIDKVALVPFLDAG